MLRKSAVILAMLLSGMVTQVWALGLGTVTVESSLNQPLRVRIAIIQLGDTRLQDVTVQMASLADFQRFDIERVGFLSDIDFEVNASQDGNYLLLTSNQVVREPYLSFVLDTRWPSGRLLSEHTVLLDLPTFSDQQQPGEPVRQPVSPILRQPATQSSATPAPQVTPPASQDLEPPQLSPAPEPEQIAPELSAADEETADSEPQAAEESEQISAAAAPAEEEAEDAGTQQSDSTPAEEDTALNAAAEPAAEEPEAEEADIPETVTTSANDTLTGIALRVRPNNSVSLQQTMLALQRLNPDAFIDDNINRLRSGQVLRIPSLSEVQEVSSQEAIAEITRQNQEFADLQPLAAPAPQQTDATAAQPELSVVTDAGEEEGSGAGAVDEEELEALDRRIAELETDLAVQQEEADRARLEREELESRLADLDEQIAAAQEIIRLQDLQLAQLQESLAQAAAEAEAQTGALPQDPAAGQADATDQQTAAQSEEQLDAETAAAVAAAEAQARAQQEARSGSLFDDLMRVVTGNLLIVGLAIVLLILLLVALLLRRNRTREEEGDELDELAEQEFDASAEDTAIATGPALFADDDEESEDDDKAPASAIDIDELLQGERVEDARETEVEDDATRPAADNTIQEADGLIEEGELDEAKSLLLGALEEDPDDHQLRLKLMEVFAREGDEEAYAAHAGIIANEQSPLLDREVGRIRERFGLAGIAVSAGAADRLKDEARAANDRSADGDSDDASSSFLDDLGIDLDAFDDEDDDDFDLLGDEDEEAEQAQKKDEPTGKTEDSPADLEDDLDDDLSDEGMLTFDLADSDDSEDQEEAESAEDADEEDSDLLSLDMSDDDEAAALEGDSRDPEDLDIEAFEFDSSPDTESEAEPEPEEDLDIETFSFESGTPEEEEATPEPEPAVEIDEENLLEFESESESESEVEPESDEADDDDIETFDFDLEDTVIEKPAAQQAETASEPELDIDEIDFDLDEIDEELTDEGDAEEKTSPVAQDDEDSSAADSESLESLKEEAPLVGVVAADVSTADEGEDDDDDLDFDLDQFMEDSAAGKHPDARDEDETEAEAAAEDEDDDFFDIDLDADADEAGAADSEEKLAEESSGKEEEDVLIELGDAAPVPPASESGQAPADEEEDDEDDSEILEDLEFMGEDDNDFDLDVGDMEEVELLNDEDEAATKLELAYAYQKMGDAEGAREILEEVVEEGNDGQVKEARKLLASLDAA